MDGEHECHGWLLSDPQPRRIRTRKIPPRCCFFSEIIMYHGRPCRPAAALLRLVALLGATKSGSSSTDHRSISTSNPRSIGSLVRSVRSEMQDPSWDLWIDKALPCPPGGIRSFRPTREFISRDRLSEDDPRNLGWAMLCIAESTESLVGQTRTGRKDEQQHATTQRETNSTTARE